jgi:hypothetical protein
MLKPSSSAVTCQRAGLPPLRAPPLSSGFRPVPHSGLFVTQHRVARTTRTLRVTAFKETPSKKTDNNPPNPPSALPPSSTDAKPVSAEAGAPSTKKPRPYAELTVGGWSCV